MIHDNSSHNNKEIILRYMNLETEKIKETEEEKEESIVSYHPKTEYGKEEEHEVVEVEEVEEEEENDEDDIIDLDLLTEETAQDSENKYIYDKDNINLNNINVQLMQKEDIVNFLLSNKLNISTQSKKESSLFNNNISSKKISKYFKDKVPRKKNYFMYTDNNPELINDFDSAYYKIVEKMNKDSSTTDANELYKILLFNNEEEVKKTDAPKRKDISNKVDFYLNKKNKSIESIQDKINEEFNKSHTFKPHTNLFLQNPRKLQKFISDQQQHVKKIKEKIEAIKGEIESKKVTNVNPHIDEKSAKIFQEKIKKDNEPVYMRLYNKKKVIKKEKKKKKLNTQNIDQKSRLREMYMEVFKRKSKLKEIGKKIREEEYKDHTQTKVSSNKILLKRFVKFFRKVIEKFKNICLDSSSLFKTNEVDSPKSKQSKDNAEVSIPKQIPENKITFEQLNSFLISMSFISKEKSYKTEEERMLYLNESVFRQKEKKLVNEIFENLKDSEDLIDKEDLYYFLLAVLNLYETFLLKINKPTKSSFNQEKKKDELKSKLEREIDKKEKERLKEEKKLTILKKLNEEITSKVKILRKYGGFDEKNKFLINLQAGELINKDFHLLYINYSNNAFIYQKEWNKQSKTKLRDSHKFKPHIDPNSKKLSVKFRKRIQSEFENEIPEKLKNSLNLQMNNSTNDKGIISGHNKIYIESLLIKKKKQEKSMAKLKEDYEKKELQYCSFKPKINTTYNSHTVDSKEARYEILFRIGTNQVKNRKDKSLQELENESFNKEVCTFKPCLVKNEKMQDENNFYNEDQLLEFQQRLENGRTQRILRDSVHMRYDFNCSNNDKITFSEKKKKIFEKKAIKDKTSTLNESSAEKTDNSEENKEGHDRGDQIPLLIIDVNIKPGMKKKIYVFDGDTADNLANKFAKEHHLDSETKYKLKILIESHMSKLLMRIDEENHSITSEV